MRKDANSPERAAQIAEKQKLMDQAAEARAASDQLRGPRKPQAEGGAEGSSHKFAKFLASLKSGLKLSTSVNVPREAARSVVRESYTIWWHSATLRSEYHSPGLNFQF